MFTSDFGPHPLNGSSHTVYRPPKDGRRNLGMINRKDGSATPSGHESRTRCPVNEKHSQRHWPLMCEWFRSLASQVHEKKTIEQVLFRYHGRFVDDTTPHVTHRISDQWRFETTLSSREGHDQVVSGGIPPNRTVRLARTPDRQRRLEVRITLMWVLHRVHCIVEKVRCTQLARAFHGQDDHTGTMQDIDNLMTARVSL